MYTGVVIADSTLLGDTSKNNLYGVAFYAGWMSVVFWVRKVGNDNEEFGRGWSKEDGDKNATNDTNLFENDWRDKKHTYTNWNIPNSITRCYEDIS